MAISVSKKESHNAIKKLAHKYPNLKFITFRPVSLPDNEIVLNVIHKTVNQGFNVILPESELSEWVINDRLKHFNDYGTMKGY